MSEIPRKFKAHPFDYHQIVEVEVAYINRLGQAVGLVDGWEVRFGYADVGECARVRIWNNQADHSLGDLLEVLSFSANRTLPQCPLFGQCSGCQYQHLGYNYQLALKSRQLGELYAEAIGSAVELAAPLASPVQYGYRTKITPHYKPIRRNADEAAPLEEKFPIGFIRSDVRRLLDVPACEIASAPINAALPALRERLQHKATTEGFRREGTALLRQSIDDEVLTDPKAMATETVAGVRYHFVAGEFFQVNRAILPLVADLVMRFVQTPYLVDAYCGVGFFALQAAKRRICKEVAGVEISAKAVELAKANALSNGLDGCVRFMEGNAEAIFETINFEADKTTVLMDPSRKGASCDFLDQLLALGPARVVYVACDPSTQARDVAYLLENGYRLVHLQALDLFPQTRHIEALAVLERSA